MNRALLFLSALLLLRAVDASAQSGRIYTQPETSDTGGIAGKMPTEELTHALAVDQERVRVFRGTVFGGDKEFRFEHLPVGKYDLVLVTKNRTVYEGLTLGGELSSLSSVSQANLEKRIAAADAFFNRFKIFRCGVEGERVLAFVERLRDRTTFQQSGDKLEANVRRLEIIELEQATDDWQMIQSRHLYREAEPIEKTPPFLHPVHVPAMGGIRVVDNVKQLGILALPKN